MSIHYDDLFKALLKFADDISAPYDQLKTMKNKDLDNLLYRLYVIEGEETDENEHLSLRGICAHLYSELVHEERYGKKFLSDYKLNEHEKYRLRTVNPNAPDYIQAHIFCSHHREMLEKDSKCGCFYCLKIFNPSEIKEWLNCDRGHTAMCPYCYTDSVIGESSGYPITKEFLKKMQDCWFGENPLEKVGEAIALEHDT